MRLTVRASSLARQPHETDLSDLTASRMSGAAEWNGSTLEIPFDVEPSEAEQAGIRRRLLTRDADHESQVAAMQAALVGLDDSPTTPAELRDAVRLALTVLLGDLA